MTEIAYPTTDAGNAARFVTVAQGRAHYDPDEGCWYVWDDRRHQRQEGDDRAMALAREVALSIDDEVATEMSDDRRRDELRKWAVRSQSKTALAAMVKVAQSMPQLWVSAGQFDQHPYLLNCLNGTIDLRTGELKPHDPADMITALVPHTYVKDQPAPIFERLIKRATAVDGSGATALFLRRVLGYMLLGGNPEQRFFVFEGPKQTGKSQIIEIVISLLGRDYALTSQPKLIATAKFGHHDSELNAIAKARFVGISETDTGMDLDEARFKSLTGSSLQVVRRMRGEERQIEAPFTIILGTNEPPNVEKWDEAIGRRLIRIPSGPTVPDSERDLHLRDRILKGEAEGVLASLVRGAMEWHRLSQEQGSGFVDMPDGVKNSTKAFQYENDHVAQFVDAAIEFGPTYSTPNRAVADAYKLHRGTDKAPMGGRALYSRIDELGKAQPHQVWHDERQFYGLRVRRPAF